MPDLMIPIVLAKTTSSAFAAVAASSSFDDSVPQNVLGGDLQSCTHEGTHTGYHRDNMCHAPGDPNHHEVCANITEDFWPESGQGSPSIFGNWCICVHKLGDWLRGMSDHMGINGIDCKATSVEALKGDPEAAKYITERCANAVSQQSVAPFALVAGSNHMLDTCTTLPRSKGAQAGPPKGTHDFL